MNRFGLLLTALLITNTYAEILAPQAPTLVQSSSYGEVHLSRLAFQNPGVFAEIIDKKTNKLLYYSLNSPLQIGLTHEQTLVLDISIVTNGFSLEIAEPKAIRSENAAIISFLPSRIALPPPPKAPPGHDGFIGLTQDGRNAGFISLQSKFLEGRLLIDNRGENGAAGGPGGDAGDPINGNPGRNYSQDKGSWAKIPGGEIGFGAREHHATAGGNGSHGGLPGAGGDGGRGGNAGLVQIDAIEYDIDLTINLKGGKSGASSLTLGCASQAGLGGQGGMDKSGGLMPNGESGLSYDDPRHPKAELLQDILNGRLSQKGVDGEKARLRAFTKTSSGDEGLRITDLTNISKEKPGSTKKKKSKKPLSPQEDLIPLEIEFEK